MALFSNLTSLQKITLAELSFRISDGGQREIYPGMNYHLYGDTSVSHLLALGDRNHAREGAGLFCR